MKQLTKTSKGLEKKIPFSFSASPSVMQEFYARKGFQSASKLIESFIVDYNKEKILKTSPYKPQSSLTTPREDESD